MVRQLEISAQIIKIIRDELEDIVRRPVELPPKHGSWCNSRGYLKECEGCGAYIYMWTCDCIYSTYLPLESWKNGNIPEGKWAFHNDSCISGAIVDRREIVRRSIDKSRDKLKAICINCKFRQIGCQKGTEPIWIEAARDGTLRGEIWTCYEFRPKKKLFRIA